MSERDWPWPKRIDRETLDDVFSLNLIKIGHDATPISDEIESWGID